MYLENSSQEIVQWNHQSILPLPCKVYLENWIFFWILHPWQHCNTQVVLICTLKIRSTILVQEVYGVQPSRLTSQSVGLHHTYQQTVRTYSQTLSHHTYQQTVRTYSQTLSHRTYQRTVRTYSQTLLHRTYQQTVRTYSQTLLHHTYQQIPQKEVICSS